MFKKISRLLFVALLLISFGLTAQGKLGANGKYTYGYKVDENGNKIKWMKFAGYPPKEPVVSKPSPDEVYVGTKDSKGLVKLDPVPSYTWCYGCTATATAMWAGYYDTFGADQFYTGPENGGVQPLSNATWTAQASQQGTDQCPVAGSKEGVDGRVGYGHGDDYWTNYEDEDTDPYVYGPWAEHDYYTGQPCTGDFMGTNQWTNWENSDGSTTTWSYLAPSGAKMYDFPDQTNPPSRDGCHGMRLFVESLGYTVDENYNQNVTGWIDADDPDAGPVTNGYDFEDFKASIDKGIPVVVGVIGHSMLGYGYDEAYSPPRIYVRNTWTTSQADDQYFTWGTDYQGMDHANMMVLHLGTEVYYAAPQNVFALNDNQEVTVTWDDPSKGTKSMSYEVYRDGGQIATTANTNYLDTNASDGLHTYSVKAVYLDPDPDFTSAMSEEVTVFVSISVTTFYDDFEDGLGDWLTNPVTGQDLSWGIDTDPAWVYAGNQSLSDSPLSETYTHTDNAYNIPGYYGDQTEELPLGGSIAEVAPGVDFSAAPDANCTFYMQYSIEESFDYLHFQACSDGQTWESLKIWSSEEVSGWNLEEISLGLFAGYPNVRFRFYMITDYGYATTGTNIDNFAITPATEDLAPPYVYYTKFKDYYTAASDGFEISTEITDFTGVDYANVLYKVNGGTEQTASAPSVMGNTYSWKLPVQNPGDLVEFRFDVQDTAPTSNQGYKGPFYYREGLQQKFDYNTVSSYTYCVTTTQDGDMQSYANEFSSFHDDIVGLIVRGYIDATAIVEEGDNDPMMIHVWGDNAGVPGADLITPFAFTNPATLSETNAWAYVDLSGYTELDNMEGTYYAGFECGTGTTGMCRTVLTSTADAGEYDFGKAWDRIWTSGVADWIQETGYNHHVRIVTTDYGYTPGILDVPSLVSNEVVQENTDSGVLDVDNIGDYSLDYNATMEYTGYPGMKFADIPINEATEDFESGFGVYSNTGAWSIRAGLTGDCAYTGTQGLSYLTSTAFDGTAVTEIWVDFDQDALVRAGGYANVEYYNGSTWQTALNQTATSAASQHVAVPNTATQIRFAGNITKQGPTVGYWYVDNIEVYGPENIIFNWLTIDGGTTTSGTVAASGTDQIALGYDATGLSLGDYTAKVYLTSDYSNANSLITMTVTEGGGNDPATPANVVTSIVGSNLVIDWDVADYATGYDVYASDDPYADAGSWTNVASVGTNQYTVAADQAKLFYYIVSTNANKSSKKVTIKKSAIK